MNYICLITIYMALVLLLRLVAKGRSAIPRLGVLFTSAAALLASLYIVLTASGCGPFLAVAGPAQ